MSSTEQEPTRLQRVRVNGREMDLTQAQMEQYRTQRKATVEVVTTTDTRRHHQAAEQGKPLATSGEMQTTATGGEQSNQDTGEQAGQETVTKRGRKEGS